MTSSLDEKAVAAAHEAYAKTTGGLLDGKPMDNAIRAYLSATALPDGMDVEPWPLGGYAPGNYTCMCLTCKASFTGDKRAHQCLPCAASQAQSALAAMRVERERNATEYETVLNSYADENQRLHDRAETLEAQVQRLTEELKNCGSALAQEVEDRLTAEARIKALEEALRGILVNPDKTSRAAARAILTQEIDRG